MLLTKTNIEKYCIFAAKTLEFRRILNYFQCFSNLNKSGDRLIKMMFFMSC